MEGELTDNDGTDRDTSSKLKMTHELESVQNPSNVETVNYLGIWHLERHSYQQVPLIFSICHMCLISL
jgi:hypothetical protein